MVTFHVIKSLAKSTKKKKIKYLWKIKSSGRLKWWAKQMIIKWLSICMDFSHLGEYIVNYKMDCNIFSMWKQILFTMKNTKYYNWVLTFSYSIQELLLGFWEILVQIPLLQCCCLAYLWEYLYTPELGVSVKPSSDKHCIVRVVLLRPSSKNTRWRKLSGWVSHHA